MKTLQIIALSAVFTHGFSNTAEAAPPSWWVTNGQPADDYAIANHGQLKEMTRALIQKLNVAFPGQGAGPNLTALLALWTAASTPDNYVQLNAGQLKEVLRPMYDRLTELGLLPAVSVVPHHYPWTAATTDDDDYAIVNLGQVKRVFDFEPSADRDGDGVPDVIEIVLLKTDPANPDSDGDGISDGLEDSDGDGVPDADELVLGLNPLVNETQQPALKRIWTYDRLGRVKTETNQAAPPNTVTVDAEGNITGIQ